ncbi:unnamed protein product [Rhizophagus irregularis]|nr:unnamed protein product [Rhizophagus irregularis]
MLMTDSDRYGESYSPQGDVGTAAAVRPEVLGGLPKIRRTKIKIVSGGLLKIERTEIKIRFGRLPGSEKWKRTKIRKYIQILVSGELLSSEEQKLRFNHVGFLVPKNGKESRFVYTNLSLAIRVFSDEQKTKIRLDGLRTNGKPRFISTSLGGLWTNGRTKIRSWASKERRMEKLKDS